MPRAARRELHGAIARYLEERLTDRADLGWLLAHHWTQAGDPARAITYLLAAAQRAQDALAVDEAYDLLTRAFDLAEDESERRRILLRRGDMLAKVGEYARADKELTALIPDLEGSEEVEALLALALSTHWTEQTERTEEVSQRALTLSRDQGFDDLAPIGLSLLAASYAMRGDRGDVARSLELANESMDQWPEGQHQFWLAHHIHVYANPMYWSGRYEEAYELSMQAKSFGGLKANSAEFVLRGAGMTGLALAGMGRYEEALAASESAIAIAQRLGRPANVVTNYSTLILREIFALEEARERSQTVADRLGPSDFNMPWMNARADLIAAELLLGELGTVEQLWPAAWDDAQEVSAWEHWLVSGRLAVARAQLELGAGKLDDAVTWSRCALEMAESGGRPKYEAIALQTLGQALTRQRLAEDAREVLTRAVAIGDQLGSPLLRWETRAALASAERAAGADPETRLTESSAIIQEVAASLAPERAEIYLASPSVLAALEG
jgi:tetratricopeptide (TPR) repeat protein